MMTYFRRAWVIAYMGLIFYLSSLQYPNTLGGFEGMDLMIHFVEYGLFAVFLYEMCIHEKSPFLRGYARSLSFFCAALYGMTDEIHQYFVPTREMSFTDWLADSLGAVLMIGLWVLIRRKLAREVIK